MQYAGGRESSHKANVVYEKKSGLGKISNSQMFYNTGKNSALDVTQKHRPRQHFLNEDESFNEKLSPPQYKSGANLHTLLKIQAEASDDSLSRSLTNSARERHLVKKERQIHLNHKYDSKEIDDSI